MRIWSRREIWLFSFGLAVTGILILSTPYLRVGAGFPPFPAPFAGFLEAFGVAVFLAGTVSFGVEELVRARTRNEFEIQLRDLLGKTGDKLSSGLQGFLKSYISDLERRIEALGHEIQGSSIEMIFSSREKGLEAMARAIAEAESFIYIMGISLREFFQMETPCTAAIGDTYGGQNGIEFKILILNNQSSEALERSAREEGIEFKGVDDPEYKARTLFRETRETITNIRKYCPEMALRVYDRQSLFLLITDKVAFMEPYHYGERVLGKPPLQPTFFKRVAELVPLVEFRKESERGPYEQFLGHFEYVFEGAREPSDENIQI